MVKLIFIIDSMISGGAERVMAILANGFSESGYDTTILSKAHIPSFYKLDDNVKLVYPETVVNYRNKFTVLITRLKLYRDLYRYLNAEKPDFVISFSTTTNGIAVIICKLLGLYVIASEHINYRTDLKSFPVWVIKRLIYPHARLLTVLTERDKDEYYGKFMENVVVMPNPLPLKPAENVNLLLRDKIILSVGDLTRWDQKGFDNLLEIFAKISPEYPDWKLVIAGSGDQGRLREKLNQLALEQAVTILGEVRDIQPLFRKSSIFALTSRWEGLPMVLLEAMSQGMACISYDCFTGPRELITDRRDGILIDDQNYKDFVSGLKELMDDQDLRMNLGEEAIETSKKYLPGEIMKKWYTILEKSSGSIE
jgi:GalNAc-alpha-(1->4)-GalNAc-alpha-(1->3)-diNAcBac-PP-undecaprenol alpha-1,4-N-acetyl-D-galactosaminyltransferase